MECLTTHSYSSYDAAWSHGVDTGSVGVVAAAQDNGAIRYGSWRFVFADYATVGGSEGSDYCESAALFLACSDCCYCCYYYCSTAHEPAMVLAP